MPSISIDVVTKDLVAIVGLIPIRLKSIGMTVQMAAASIILTKIDRALTVGNQPVSIRH